VLKLLQAGMPESVVLNKIHAITDKFDTSTSALVTLKQAGASDAELNAVLAQVAAPVNVQPVAAPASNGPSLAESMQFIQDMVNQQGSIAYIVSVKLADTIKFDPTPQRSQETQVVAVDPAGGLSLQEKDSFPDSGYRVDGSATWQMNFKDVEKLEVQTMADAMNHADQEGNVFVVNPQVYELLVHLTSGKTVRGHFQVTTTCSNAEDLQKQGLCTSKESDYNPRDFILFFRDEETANRVAKAMIHAIELCGGGSK
jgi:hypothetical protein